MPRWERSRICEVPLNSALLPHRGLADAFPRIQIFRAVIAAELLRSDGSATGNSRRQSQAMMQNVSE
jgi:hypothetical protein